MEEEDRPRPKGSFPELGGALEGRSREELEAYLRALRAEIARVEDEMRRRQAIRGAAEALFKVPRR
ncbi:hypothetical protein HRbin40_00724 [bacterium HR40]|nr:hypothetical protein HRbin40_00724 [bacterium HR40]